MSNPPSRNAPSPVWGCSFFIIILLLVSFVIFSFIYSYFNQKSEVASITVAKPLQMPKKQLLNTKEEQLLLQRLRNFEQQVKRGKYTKISLSLSEANHLLSHQDAGDLGSILYIKKIGDSGSLACIVCLPVKKSIQGGNCYLNSRQCHIYLTMQKGYPYLKFECIEPIVANNSKKCVVPKRWYSYFSQGYSKKIQEMAWYKDILGKVTTCSTEADSIIIIADPKKQVVTNQEIAEIKAGKSEGSRIGMYVIIFVVIFAAMMLYRYSKK